MEERAKSLTSFGVFVVNFEYISYIILLFPSLFWLKINASWYHAQTELNLQRDVAA